VADVLVMAAFKLGHPVLLFIEVKTDNPLLHGCDAARIAFPP